MNQERPIIFSTPMVKAILEGRKTQTRRIIKSRHESGLFRICRRMTDNQITSIESLDWDERNCEKDITCPYGKPGDILYVRETFLWDWEDYPQRTKKYFVYKASTPDYQMASGEHWLPSIHMPKVAARIFLKITGISVERLQDISIDDAVDEGIEYAPEGRRGEYHGYMNYYPEGDDSKTIGFGSSIRSFKSLWSKINGPGSWEQNPWIWKITFERIEKPQP